MPPRRSLLSLVVLTAFLAPAFPPGTLAADPFEINVILPITGGAAFLGKAEQVSLGVAEETINKTGGINGRPVRFVIQDDQSNPQVAVQLLGGVLAKNPPIVLGSTLTGICSAMAPLVKDSPVLWCFSNGYQPPDVGWVYSSGVSATDEIMSSVRYMHDRGWRKIGVVASNDASGQQSEHAVDLGGALHENAGTAVVAREHFTLGDVSVAAQMARIKAAGAQVLWAATTGTAFATILRAAADSGFDVPVMTGAGNEIYAQMKAYAPFLPKELYFASIPAMSPEQLPAGPVKRAVVAFIGEFTAKGLQPDIGTNQPWDTAFIVVNAFKRLGTNASATQLRNYFDGLRGYVGAAGEYDFRTYPKRGLGPTWTVVQRWDPVKETFVGVSKPGGAPL